MATTNFVDGTTVIVAAWLNDIDATVYGALAAATTPAEVRTALSLVIGTDVQAYDASLTSLAALATAADKFPYTTGIDTYAEATITAAGRALLDDASASAQRTTLGVVIGTDVQAHDASLDSLSALATAADKVPYTTGIDTYAEANLTAAGRALIDDASAADQRTTLGLGTLATQNTVDNGDWSGADLSVANGGTGVSTLTDNGVLIGNGSGAIQATAVGTSGQVLTSNGAGLDPTFQTPGASNDEKVKVSANDTTEGYLNGKLVAGSNITLTENNDGANETLTIASTGVSAGSITRSSLSTATVELAGSLNTDTTLITLNAYAFFPMIHVSSIDDSGVGVSDETAGLVSGHTTDGASADSPRFGLTGDVKFGGTYDVDYRYIQA